MRNPMTTKHSAVNGVIGVQLIYKDIIKYIIKEKTQKDPSRLQKATKLGMAWGYVTGESKNVDASTTLAVSGIHNVISLLEEIERGELKNVDFIELQACIGGCVGGPLNIHNLFVGRVRLRELIKKCGSKPSYYTVEELLRFYTQGHYASTEPVQPKAIMHLDEDMSKAIQKMERLDQIQMSSRGSIVVPVVLQAVGPWQRI